MVRFHSLVEIKGKLSSMGGTGWREDNNSASGKCSKGTHDTFYLGQGVGKPSPTGQMWPLPLTDPSSVAAFTFQ